MRCAILADIHSNLIAFRAVLDDIDEKGGVEEIWCLGDVVGYGPDPRECLALLRQHNHCCVAGNHDWAAVSKIDISDFNPHAAEACRWTSSQLLDEDIIYLSNLPLMLEKNEFTLVHGSPREPIWEYILSTRSAVENFSHFTTRYCLVGHSHIPLAFSYSDETRVCQPCDIPAIFSLKGDTRRFIINPGGIGQPRDNDPRASYAILDVEKEVIRHYRVAYDISATQNRMMELGLPSRLITRLSYGQ